MLSFDDKSLFVNGKREFLVSGEFHYFRVPKDDWERRMDLFMEAGGNCLATYVPWIIHEREEGKILFGDTPKRDLDAFLSAAERKGLAVIVRPGPYQYSELLNDGLPSWLLENYPEIAAMTIEGKPFRKSSVSYMHPVFLEKARRYFREAAKAIRPHLASGGGCVAMVQVDNELTGIHKWFGSLDYNRDTFGFGREDGFYASWLKGKYGSLERLNAAYGKNWTSFSEAMPEAGCDTMSRKRMARDYKLCYLSQCAKYLATLASWLREDGIDAPLCHNAANPYMNAEFTEPAERLGKDFLLGSDHYYCLNQQWEQENPTPRYMFNVQLSCDLLRAMSMPPVVFEMPGGSLADTPPILKNDLLAAYMANLAVGMKGLNYYVFTGGENYPGTGTTADLYDYNALVHADGTLNETYEAAKQFGLFLKSHGKLLEAKRHASVQLGIEFDYYRNTAPSPAEGAFDGANASEFLCRGILYSLHGSCYSQEHVSLSSPLDLSRPLVLAAPGAMSGRAQRNVLDYLEKGGSLICFSDAPGYDLDLNPCTVLKDGARLSAVAKGGGFSQAIDVMGTRVYSLCPKGAFESLPEGARAIAKDPESGKILGYCASIGKGMVVHLSFTWFAVLHSQSEMLESILEMLGAEKSVKSSNRHVQTSHFLFKDGGHGVFAMNLHSSPQRTEITVFGNGSALRTVPLELGAMEVRYLELDGEGRVLD